MVSKAYITLDDLGNKCVIVVSLREYLILLHVKNQGAYRPVQVHSPISEFDIHSQEYSSIR